MTIQLTERAVIEVKKYVESQLEEWLKSGMITSKDEASPGLRVSVQGGGCSGFMYHFEIGDEQSGDVKFDSNGAKVYTDIKSFPYLDGATVDYIDTPMEKKFIIINPNETHRCGCGTSFDVG